LTAERPTLSPIAGAFVLYGAFAGAWAVSVLDITRTFDLSDTGLGVMLAIGILFAAGPQRDRRRADRPVGTRPRPRPIPPDLERAPVRGRGSAGPRGVRRRVHPHDRGRRARRRRDERGVGRRATGLALACIGISVVWPLLLADVNNEARHPALAIGGVSAAGYLGMVAGPPIVGVLSGAFDLTTGLVVLAAVASFVAVTPAHVRASARSIR
jgi:hypothetical protein